MCPLYDYKCNECDTTFEKLLPISRYKEAQDCPHCGSDAFKILVLGHGGIQDDSPVWLNESIVRQLQDTDDPGLHRIETRTDYNKHLKDNGVIPTN